MTGRIFSTIFSKARLAPLPGGEVPMRTFEPALSRPQEREVWRAAWEAARDFWQTAAGG